MCRYIKDCARKGECEVLKRFSPGLDACHRNALQSSGPISQLSGMPLFGHSSVDWCAYFNCH